MARKRENQSGFEERWMVFSLREKKCSDEWKEMLKRSVVKSLKCDSDDVRYVEENDNPVLSSYFFVRERNDSDYQRTCDAIHDSVDFYSSVPRITDEECQRMVGSLISQGSKQVDYGDFVLITRGKYRKLYGVALREHKDGRIEVGLKFCFGPVIETYDVADLKVIGNIFKHIKMPML